MGKTSLPKAMLVRYCGFTVSNVPKAEIKVSADTTQQTVLIFFSLRKEKSWVGKENSFWGRMYMVAPEGSIIGRRLEVESLRQLMPTAKEIDAMFCKKQ